MSRITANGRPLTIPSRAKRGANGPNQIGVVTVVEQTVEHRSSDDGKETDATSRNHDSTDSLVRDIEKGIR